MTTLTELLHSVLSSEKQETETVYVFTCTAQGVNHKISLHIELHLSEFEEQKANIFSEIFKFNKFSYIPSA